jgi:hypothetical protein
MPQLMADKQYMLTKFVGMFMVCLDVKFHIRKSYDLLIISVKLKARCEFYAVAILLF